MSRRINKVSDRDLLKSAKEGVKKEIERKLAEGMPVTYYDKEKKCVYRINAEGNIVNG